MKGKKPAVSAAASARLPKVMLAQYNKAVKEPNEHVKFMMTDNVQEWYVLLTGIEGTGDAFKGGEYLVLMKAPDDFPFSPPQFYFKTDNGLYGKDTKVCISIGEFHKDNYMASLGMGGFATQLVSGMVGWDTMGGGISILSTCAAEKQEFARKSRAYNREKYPDIMKNLDAAFAEYSAKWERTPATEPVLRRMGLISSAPNANDNNVQHIDELVKKVDDVKL